MDFPRDLRQFVNDLRANPERMRAKDSYGRTLIAHAVQKYKPVHLEIILLLDASAINETDSDGVAPIHLAAMAKDRKMVDILCYFGADVDLRLQSGCTAMHWAAYKGQHSVMEILKSYGSRALTIKNNKGQTPLDVARAHNPPSAVTAIESLQNQIDVHTSMLIRTNIVCALLARDWHTVDVLCELHTPFIDHEDRKCFTPMHYAARTGMGYGVRRLHAAGSTSLDAQTSAKYTPMHYSIAYGPFEAFVALHCLGSEAHFMQNRSSCAPVEMPIVRRCYFSRSLCEVLFYAQVKTAR